MTIPNLPTTASSHTARSPAGSPQSQRGVVLIIALILLVVISLLAVTSMRSASSSENVAGNVRTTELGMQAAEIALRYCENSVREQITTSTLTATPTIMAYSATPRWSARNTSGELVNWDGPTSTPTYALPLNMVNQAGMAATYQRPPECLVEPLPVMPAGTTTVSTNTSFVVTARGFGPEVVAADNNRSRPRGTEVWLQSHIQLAGTGTGTGTGRVTGTSRQHGYLYRHVHGYIHRHINWNRDRR